jgi:ElaB/YqjD/DUF883 family membrane-anchored ribosome-binding protein
MSEPAEDVDTAKDGEADATPNSEAMPEVEATASEVTTLAAQETPADRAIRSARKSLEAARIAAAHAADAVRFGKDALPELGERARESLDEQAGKLRDASEAAAADPEETLEEARTLIVKTVNARPLAAALSAVGFGVVLGMLMKGRRR